MNGNDVQIIYYKETASAGIRYSSVFNVKQVTDVLQRAIMNAEGELGRRIRDMGLIPGASVEVVGKAPLRDPVALRIEGTTIALRNSEADYITVEIS